MVATNLRNTTAGFFQAKSQTTDSQPWCQRVEKKDSKSTGFPTKSLWSMTIYDLCLFLPQITSAIAASWSSLRGGTSRWWPSLGSLAAMLTQFGGMAITLRPAAQKIISRVYDSKWSTFEISVLILLYYIQPGKKKKTEPEMGWMYDWCMGFAMYLGLSFFARSSLSAEFSAWKCSTRRPGMPNSAGKIRTAKPRKTQKYPESHHQFVGSSCNLINQSLA